MSESVGASRSVGVWAPARTLRLFVELSKPRLAGLLLAVTLVTYQIASQAVLRSPVEVPLPAISGLPFWYLFVALTTGVVWYASGMFALNQYLERDLDRLMVRTAGRPLPSGRMQPQTALVYGVASVLVGTAILTVWVNVLCGVFALINLFVYLALYTPLKRITPLHTFIGAFAGAMPPLVGWTALTGSPGIEAWGLASIVFAWQFPHFYSVELKNLREYRRAQVKVLPVTDQGGRRVRAGIAVWTILTLAASFTPLAVGLVRWWYAVPATALWIPFGYHALETCRHYDVRHARKLLRTSVLYLPLVFALIAVSLV